MIDQGELFIIPNPCKGICTSNNRGYCKGCLRSRQERFHWNEFSPFQQQLIINLCEKRRQKIIAARNPISDDETDNHEHQPDLFDAPLTSGHILQEQANAPASVREPAAVSEPVPTSEPEPLTSETPRGSQFDLF